MTRPLESWNYRVTGASSVAEAREQLHRDSFALVLCDVNIPGESGLDLLRALSAQRPDVATVMVTGQDDPGLAETALDLGAYGYVIKPFAPNELRISVTKRGPLTTHERTAMQTHTEVGHRILAGSGSELLDLAATIAPTHHERYDGTGYPHRLAGEAIPLEGRIIAVADVFDAVTTDRPYRDKLQHADAVALLVEERGAHFDAAIVDCFVNSRALRLDTA
jgi:putative two-component system response regulator